jgi:hypothetical protein
LSISLLDKKTLKLHSESEKRNYRWHKSTFLADIAQPYALRNDLKLSCAFHSLPRNTVIDHFSDSCEQIDPRLRQHRFVLRWKKVTLGRGGKKYWVVAAAARGIYESEEGLRFRDE